MKKMTIEEKEFNQTMRWLMPWKKKTGGAQLIGLWEDRLSVTMMLKLLELWLSEGNRLRLRKLLLFYHPVDQAAMAYALLVYVMTGTRMKFKNQETRIHYNQLTEAIKEDMPELMFAGHLKYMMRRYGKRV